MNQSEPDQRQARVPPTDRGELRPWLFGGAWILFLVMLASAFGFVACGQGGAPGESQTPAAEFRQFTSSIKGYSIEYPADWSVKTEQPVKGTNDGLTEDQFISPDQKVTVGVVCYVSPHANTIDEFLQNVIKVLKLGGFSDVRVEKDGLIVAGTPVPMLDYTLTAGGSTSYLTTVLVFKDCQWDITISTSANDREMYRDLFEQMATSFTPG